MKITLKTLALAALCTCSTIAFVSCGNSDSIGGSESGSATAQFRPTLDQTEINYNDDLTSLPDNQYQIITATFTANSTGAGLETGTVSMRFVSGSKSEMDAWVCQSTNYTYDAATGIVTIGGGSATSGVETISFTEFTMQLTVSYAEEEWNGLLEFFGQQSAGQTTVEGDAASFIAQPIWFRVTL